MAYAYNMCTGNLDGQETSIAINLSIKRPDGKVETDTIYRSKMMTQEDCDMIGQKYDCDVIVSCVGRLIHFPNDVIDGASFYYKKGERDGNIDPTRGAPSFNNQEVPNAASDA